MPIHGWELDSSIRIRALALGLIRVSLHISLWLTGVQLLHSQVLMTGETGGKGSRTVAISANAIAAAGLGVLSNNWVQYGFGLHNRVDACIGYGNVAIFGRSQSYAVITSNIGVLGRSRAGLDAALYNTVSVPINRRREASASLLGSAFILSRPLKVGSRNLTVYSGAIRQTPLGQAQDPIFTPVSAVYNGITGVSVALGKSTAILLEYNPGTIQHSGGMAVVYTFPRKTESAGANGTTKEEGFSWPATR